MAYFSYIAVLQIRKGSYFAQHSVFLTRSSGSILKAKKSFGQHFLHKDDVARRIAGSLSQPYPRVLEVGPGKGMLTKYLVADGRELVAVEADRDMVDYLQQFFPPAGLRIIAADFLRLDLAGVFAGQPFALIGNFPYNISSQILFHMLDYRALVPEMVGMFQREVAVRVVSGPGNKDYGVISVLLQAFYEGQYLFTVDKSCFSPPPQVQSGVIRLLRKPAQSLPCDEALFRQVVKQSFGQRRKMLRNTLKPFFEKKPGILQEEFFLQRPEELSVQAFIELAQRIEETNAGG